jgi:outer membrane protein assembly factor BamC
MIKLRNVVVLAVALAVVGGCSMFGSKSKPQETPAKQRKALEVPPDLARPAGGDAVAVPGEAVASSNSAARPATAETPVADSKPAPVAPPDVTLEHSGAQYWLAVKNPPERAWSRAREYFLRNNIKLAVEDPKTGVLETAWTDRAADKSGGIFNNLLGKMNASGMRDRYRVRVDAGAVPGTSEVHVSHYLMEEMVITEGYSHSVKWQSREPDRQKEVELLKKLQASLGTGAAAPAGTTPAAAPAATAPQAGADSQARLVRIKNGSVIQLDQDFDSSWKTLGSALDRGGVTVEDRDRSGGIYFVRVANSGDEPLSFGIFGRIFIGERDAEDKQSQGRFQVRLKAAAPGTTVSVLNTKGEPDTTKSGERLLNLLYQQLR